MPSSRLLNHEMIHFWQALWLGFVGFWLLYACYYIKGLIIYRNFEKAYFNNPFEREAYENDKHMTYLLRRKPWAWRMYIKIN